MQNGVMSQHPSACGDAPIGIAVADQRVGAHRRQSKYQQRRDKFDEVSKSGAIFTRICEERPTPLQEPRCQSHLDATQSIQPSYMCTDERAHDHGASNGDCYAVGYAAAEIAFASNHGKDLGLLYDKARKCEHSAAMMVTSTNWTRCPSPANSATAVISLESPAPRSPKA